MPNGLYFIEEAKVRLGESLSTAAAQQSMLYAPHVRRIANRIAQRTYSLYASCVTDIISGKVTYEIPRRPFRLGSVCVNDGNGNIFPLAGVTYEQADGMFYNWRNQNSPQQYQGVPAYYIDDGARSYTLLPVPNYNAQSGLLVNGYIGVDKWWNMADECPLPQNEAIDEAIIYGVCAERAMEMKKIDASYGSVQKDYEMKFAERLRELYRQAVGLNEARRNALPSMGKKLGAWSGGWGVYGGGD
jgi:hypothetical protein